MDNKITNEELILKCEYLLNEYAISLKEVFMRYMNKQISHEQFERIQNLSASMTSNMFDMLMEKGMTKEDLKGRMNNLLEICTDKNR